MISYWHDNRHRIVKPVPIHTHIENSLKIHCLEIWVWKSSNSQQYIVWVKIIDFSFMPKIIRY